MSRLLITNFKTGAVVYDSLQDHDELALGVGDLCIQYRPIAQVTHMRMPIAPLSLYMTDQEAERDEAIRDLHDKYFYEPPQQELGET